jgi:hypothetical protein
MPRNYVHLSGRDVDEALLKTHGLVKPKEAKEFIFLSFGAAGGSYSNDTVGGSSFARSHV